MSIVLLKVLLVVSYLAMIFMNFLANALPLNNQNTGAISDKYPSLFTPSGFTFSIWGIIYILLGIYVVQMLFTSQEDFSEMFLKTTMIVFIVTSALNIFWLICWHYDQIILSSIVMSIFLAILLYAVLIIPNNQVLIKSAFSLYAGWLSVAFIANVTITLINLDVKFFLSREVFWYIVIIVVGLLIVGLVLFLTKNVVYGLVFVWAYYGILAKHKAEVGHFVSEPWAINVTMGLLILISLGTLATFALNDFKLFSK